MTIKRKILKYRKIILYYSRILIIIFIEITAILVFYLSDILRITKEMLYWLFAATSQSMAALFAIVGVFAVFRYEILSSRLRNLYDSLKSKFSSVKWGKYFDVTEPKGWEDSIIADRVEELLEIKENRLPHNIKFDIRMHVLYIRHHEKARDGVLNRAKIPLVAVLITFIFSIIFIPLAESISKSIFGLIILLIVLALITFSIVNLFYYLIYSITPNKSSA